MLRINCNHSHFSVVVDNDTKETRFKASRENSIGKVHREQHRLAVDLGRYIKSCIISVLSSIGLYLIKFNTMV